MENVCQLLCKVGIEVPPDSRIALLDRCLKELITVSQIHVSSYPLQCYSPKQRMEQSAHGKGISPPLQDIGTDISLHLEVQTRPGTAPESLRKSSPRTRPAGTTQLGEAIGHTAPQRKR